MSHNTSGTLRELLTQLCKHWLLTIRVDVPDQLQEDIVRQAVGMLANAHKAASQLVLENIQQAQHMIRCCVKEVQRLVLAKVT